MVEEEDASPFAAFDFTDADVAPPPPRQMCDKCGRPSRTCLCPYLPRPRVANDVHVVVLMHPKELERKISTAKLAAMSLQRCDVLVGRDLNDFAGTGECKALDAALAPALAHNSVQVAGSGDSGSGSGGDESSTWTEDCACVLFPGDPLDASVADLSLGSSSARSDAGGAVECDGAGNVAAAAAAAGLLARVRSRVRYLIVFDGTWRFAREMFVKARKLLALARVRQVHFSRPFACGGSGLVAGAGGGTEAGVEAAVQSDGTVAAAAAGGQDTGLSEFVTRVQPAENCASTLEAIVAALLVLQPTLVPRRGELLRPLRAMMRFQLGQGSLFTDGALSTAEAGHASATAPAAAAAVAVETVAAQVAVAQGSAAVVGACPTVDAPLLAPDASSQCALKHAGAPANSSRTSMPVRTHAHVPHRQRPWAKLAAK